MTGCVGRGFRLGSERSSGAGGASGFGAAGGAWESGNLGMLPLGTGLDETRFSNRVGHHRLKVSGALAETASFHANCSRSRPPIM